MDDISRQLKSKEIIRINNKSNKMILTWTLNNICPFHCWYCPDDLHRGKNNQFGWEDIEIFLNEFLSRYPIVHASISGGEPTMSPFLIQMVDRINENHVENSVGMTTNGIRTLRWFKDNAYKFTYLCFSFHPHMFNDDGDIEEFLEKVKLSGKYTRSTIRLSMSPRDWSKSLKLYNLCDNDQTRTYNFEAVRLLNYSDPANITFDVGYTDEQDKWFTQESRIHHDYSPLKPYTQPLSTMGGHIVFEDGSKIENFTSQSVVQNKVNDFRGWQCMIGLEQMYIHHNGQIKRGNCMTGGCIGVINDIGNIKWPSDPIRCADLQCHCATDLFTTKWNPKKVNGEI